jgi:hypothetical protein
MNTYAACPRRSTRIRSRTLLEQDDREQFRLCGIASNLVKKLSKKDNRPWVAFTLATKRASLALNMFADAFAAYGPNLQENLPVAVLGTVMRGEDGARVNVKECYPLDNYVTGNIRRVTWLLHPAASGNDGLHATAAGNFEPAGGRHADQPRVSGGRTGRGRGRGVDRPRLETLRRILPTAPGSPGGGRGADRIQAPRDQGNSALGAAGLTLGGAAEARATARLPRVATRVPPGSRPTPLGIALSFGAGSCFVEAMSDSAVINRAARVLARVSPQLPADDALREEMAAHRQLSPAEKRAFARAVFIYYRWLNWLDDGSSLQARLATALDLQARFDRDPTAIKTEALAARAVPEWAREEMTFEPDDLRALQRDPVLWIRGQREHAPRSPARWAIVSRLPHRRTAPVSAIKASRISSKRTSFTKASSKSRISRRSW